ncbi:MAG: glycosyltransferase [Pseudomonadota bacterium]|nr:MAG: glycosyltransferase [Pseudomonadota bacterium]
MNAVDWLITIYVLGFCAWWCVYYVAALRAVLAVPLFEDQDATDPSLWPKLSVIVPACNEAQTIEVASRTLLAQDYPQLEVIFVNDRSSDGTGEIIDALATTHTGVHALHVSELPEGWLGKVHALDQGMRIARGDWILFTDADVHFEAGTLRRAVGAALARNCDHLTLFPRVDTCSYWLDVVMAAFRTMFLLGMRVHRLDETGSDAVVGVGAFSLFKRSALERSPGLRWLRMEVVDDLGLGLLLKRAGAASCFALARFHLNVRWYESLGQMFAGLEKNAFGTAAHYRYGRMLMIVAYLWAFSLAPLVAIGAVHIPGLWIAGAAAYGTLVSTQLVAKHRVGVRVLPGLLIPVGQLIFSVMLFNAGLRCLRQGGIRWRGTIYPLAQLRAGQRVRL